MLLLQGATDPAGSNDVLTAMLSGLIPLALGIVTARMASSRNRPAFGWGVFGAVFAIIAIPLLWFLGPAATVQARGRASGERAAGSVVLWALADRGGLTFDELLDATGLSEDALMGELDGLLDEELIDTSHAGFVVTDSGRTRAPKRRPSGSGHLPGRRSS